MIASRKPALSLYTNLVALVLSASNRLASPMVALKLGPSALMFSIAILLNLILFSSVAMPSLFAAEPSSSAAQPSNTSASPSASSNAPTSGDGSRLKGGAQVIEVHVQNVRDVGLDLKRAIQSASGLYDEVTRAPVEVGTRPEVIGFQVITLPSVSFDTSQTLPARKEWVDHYVAEIDKVLTLLKSDVEKIRAGEVELKWPDGTEEMFTQLVTDWMANVEKSYASFEQLKTLTTNPPYDNGAIAKGISQLRKDLLAVDKVRKAVYSKLQKHGKSKMTASRK